MNMEMQYIGVCSLLGRLSGQIKDSERRYCIKRALDDCVAQFPGRFEVVKTSSGGWSLEPTSLTANANVTGLAPEERENEMTTDIAQGPVDVTVGLAPGYYWARIEGGDFTPVEWTGKTWWGIAMQRNYYPDEISEIGPAIVPPNKK